MTENSFFEGAPQPEAAAGNRRLLAIVGGAAAAALLAGGGYFLVGGGGEDATEATSFGVPSRAKVTKVTTAKAKAAAKAKPAAKLPVVSTVRLGRDPFLALYMQPVAAAATTPTSTGSTATTTDAGAGSVATEPYALTLLSISGTDSKRYTFNVGTDKKTVVTAQKFGKFGELVVLSYVKNSKGVINGALVQVGDDDPVTVRIGEKVTVL